jgi:hypothetical protein
MTILTGTCVYLDNVVHSSLNLVQVIVVSCATLFRTEHKMKEMLVREAEAV